MKKLLIIGIILSSLSGCAHQVPTNNLHNQFNPAEAKKLLEEGKNSVKGEAFLRQNGGGIITWAGTVVSLIPKTHYTEERLQHIYGVLDYNDVKSSKNSINFNPNPFEYTQLQKETKCNSRGGFEFNNVADGDFYITTYVQWQVVSSQGAGLIQKVQLSNESTKKIILTH